MHDCRKDASLTNKAYTHSHDPRSRFETIRAVKRARMASTGRNRVNSNDHCVRGCKKKTHRSDWQTNRKYPKKLGFMADKGIKDNRIHEKWICPPLQRLHHAAVRSLRKLTGCKWNLSIYYRVCQFFFAPHNDACVNRKDEQNNRKSYIGEHVFHKSLWWKASMQRFVVARKIQFRCNSSIHLQKIMKKVIDFGELVHK